MTVAQSDELTWADIEADVGPYRDGFVRVFLKYRGAKVDGVKLTKTAFANHFGIARETFRNWVRVYLDKAGAVLPKLEATPGDGDLITLMFRAPRSVARRFKVDCASKGISMQDALLGLLAAEYAPRKGEVA